MLVAFKGVRGWLSDLRLLAHQTEILEGAAGSAGKSSRPSVIRHKAGLVSYIEVIDSQRTALATETSLIQARAGRLSTTVLHVRALGGGG